MPTRERLGVDIAEADYPKLATLNGAIDHLTTLTQNAATVRPLAAVLSN